MGESLDRMEFFDLHRTKFADFTKIVPAEVYQHIVLGKFFGIGAQRGFHGMVLCGGFPSWSGSGKRKCVKHAVFQFD